jgi:hypothetical protein
MERNEIKQNGMEGDRIGQDRVGWRRVCYRQRISTLWNNKYVFFLLYGMVKRL